MNVPKKSRSLSHKSCKPKGPRSMARLWAVKALFRYDQEPLPARELIHEMRTLWMTGDVLEDASYNEVDQERFSDIISATLSHLESIDTLLKPLILSSWSWERVDPVMRAIMRAGCGEKQLQDLSDHILINEYVDIASTFLDSAATGFVNRTLHQALKGDKHP